MISVKLDDEVFKFLLESNLNKDIKDVIIQHSIKEHSSIILSVERNTANAIVDFLGDEFVQTGLKENDEPNETGIMIENIIDKFQRELYI